MPSGPARPNRYKPLFYPIFVPVPKWFSLCFSSSLLQDVSEFSHKLLDWLEDAFQLAANGR